MDPLIAANKRSDTFEEYEKADAMEEVYYRDTCCIVKDTESCKLDCVDDHCYKGRIEMVYMGFFGFIEGECPNFAHKWK
jgi:hypothetical protein